MSDAHSSAVAPQTDGLSSAEAERCLQEFGPNDPAPTQKHSAWRAFLRLFLNPLAIILLLAAFVSNLIGQHVDAGIVVVMVLLGIGLDFLQTHRSQVTIERLRAGVSPTATVRRDGIWSEIPRRNVVPGDRIRLAAGDLVPADARLLESKDLFVQQAALTGESLPADKHVSAAAASNDPDAINMVFLGSSVTAGTAIAEVAATGSKTAFGNIASSLSREAAETAFDRGLRDFSILVARAVFFLTLFLIIVSIASHRDPFESMLFAVALAVGLTPEFLPMITSVTLSKGALAMARKKVVVKHLSAIQNLGSIDILCSDKTGTLTSGEVVMDRAIDLSGAVSPHVHLLGYINSTFETAIRSPLDRAIVVARPAGTDGYSKCDEIPFDFERRRASIVVEQGSKRTMATKGAAESILALSVAYEVNGQVLPVNPEVHQRAKELEDHLGQQGFRVLAVAYRDVPVKAAYSHEDEENFVFAGYLVFRDPLLPDATQALEALRADGVEVKIISGDSEVVCRHVAQEVGLDAAGLVSGSEVDQATDPALAQISEHASVFARIAPAGKSRILSALRRRGHVAGYMGDGINDAPSLHSADVGISVSSAVDVAREAADIILLEPGLRVLHDGILEGRRAFGNVMKYLLMGTSSNFGNMLSMAGASLFLPFLPMTPTQILLNNFIYDLSQLSIPTDRVDESFLRKPQHWDIRLIRKFMLYIGPISSIFDFLTFYVMLHVFRADEAEFHTGWFVESLATQTLVLFVIRTVHNPFRSRPSTMLTITTLSAVAFAVALPFSPLARPLGFVPLPASYFAFLGGATLAYLGLVELAKRWVMPKPVEN
jgi:P-type Mg2+ transporter